MTKATTIAEVMAGEARSEEDLEMIASTIVNRAQLAGVSLESIVQAPKQFDAYGKSLPAGTTKRDVARAQAILDRVVKEGVPPQYANALGYARDYAVDNLPKSWQPTGIVTPDKHVVFTAPPDAYIATAQGYVAPKGQLGNFTPDNSYSPPVNTSNPFEAQPNAGPAGWAYRDLVGANPVRTVATGPEGLLDKPRGMEALAPHGLIEKYGPNRPNRPHEGIITIADRAVKDVLGPDWSAVGTSGMEDAGKDYSGAGRHPTGDALDFYAENTKTGQSATHAQMAKVSQQAAALGATGVGFGAGYMDKDGIAKAHIDTARPNAPRSWGAAGTWSTMDPSERESIMGGMMLGTPAVASFNPGDALPDNPNKMSAPLGPVERQSLPDVPQYDMAGSANGLLGPSAQGAGLVPGQPSGGIASALSPISSAAAADAPTGPQPGYIGANAPGAVNLNAGMQLASLAPTEGLPGFQPTPQKDPRTLQAQPDFQYTNLPPDRQMPTGLLGAPTTATKPGLLGVPPTSLAQQETALAAMKPGFTPQQPTVQQAAPSLSAPQTVQDAPTIAQPQQATQQQQTISYPEQPERPSVLQAALASPAVKQIKDAIGLLNPLSRAQGLLGGVSGLLSGPAGPSAANIDAGSGMQAMERGMYGERGTFGRSLSNPGAFSVSRGPGQGYDLTNQYGARTTYGPSGDIRANRDTMRAWGGLLDHLFGGGLLDRPDKDKDKSRGGPVGGYSGNGLY